MDSSILSSLTENKKPMVKNEKTNNGSGSNGNSNPPLPSVQSVSVHYPESASASASPSTESMVFSSAPAPTSASELRETNFNEKIPFWAENPNILFRPEYLLEFFPTEDMTYEQKMNAITRLITILSILAFLISKNLRILFIFIVILGGISLAYYAQTNRSGKTIDAHIDEQQEPYSNFDRSPGMDYLQQNKLMPTKPMFDSPSSVNPMANVLMTDYDYNPTKKPAAPAYNKNVNEDILNQAKQFIADAHPDQPDIAKKLFKNVDDQIDFEHSMRQFYSSPNTMIPNDQQAFAEFCYGSMVSCKEGNRFACARNLARHTN